MTEPRDEFPSSLLQGLQLSRAIGCDLRIRDAGDSFDLPWTFGIPVSEPIIIPIADDIAQRIAEHNARADYICITRGSNCQPFQTAEITKPTAVEMSRVTTVAHVEPGKDARP